MLAHCLDIVKRQVRVEPLHLAPNRADHVLRFGAGVDDERHVTVVLARHRIVDEGSRGFAESKVLAVFHYADDLKARIVGAASAQTFADWILPRPETSREGFVYDHEARFILVIQYREIEAFEQVNAHPLEITRPDEAVWHLRQIGGARKRLAFHINNAAVEIKIERQRVNI